MSAPEEVIYHAKSPLKEGFQAGAIGAGVGVLVSAAQNSIGSHSQGAIGVFSRTGGTIGIFAAMAGVFAATDSAVGNIREKKDAWNSIAAGCAAGMVAGGFQRSPQTMVFGCVSMGAMMGAFDVSGNSLKGKYAEITEQQKHELREAQVDSNEIAVDIDRELLVYRDTSIGSYGSAEMDLSKAIVGAVRHGASGHNSPVMNMSEVSQPSIHQYISHNLAGGGSTSSNNSSRVLDIIPNNSNLSPTYHQQYYQGSSSNGREEQTAADHVVLYTILRELCSLRMILIRTYRLLSSSTVDIDVDNLLIDAEQALQTFDSASLEIQVSVLGVGIGYEIRVLKHGLVMDKAVSEYDIQKSVTNLHLACVALAEWRRISSEQEYEDKSYHRPEETSWRYSIFASSSEDKNKSAVKGKFNLHPNHLQWLGRWIASEKCKMTIYFMNVLLEKEQAMGGDERSLWANIEPDLHGMIRTFRKKAGPHSVSFVYEISRDVRFSAMGFVSANAPYESPTGLNSFPCIYSYPPEPPRDHWPNIISIMQGSVNILRHFRSQYFYDHKIGCTYYIARIDKHVSVVIIYLDKHTQPDAGAMDFLQLLAGKLRHTEVLSALRLE
ncbi:hypothetical protein BGZ54_008699 [Gamsiella multidivaricata]|nr:hypothetical protein BGZ54_008699 [Gamsiella multidivaricata]